MISGQFYFILLLLYFFNRIRIDKLTGAIKEIYFEREFDASWFEVIYTAELKRLYKEGMLVKIVDNNTYFYELTQKGYYNVKVLLEDVVVRDRSRLVNKIRMDIMASQYY